MLRLQYYFKLLVHVRMLYILFCQLLFCRSPHKWLVITVAKLPFFIWFTYHSTYDLHIYISTYVLFPTWYTYCKPLQNHVWKAETGGENLDIKIFCNYCIVYNPHWWLYLKFKFPSYCRNNSIWGIRINSAKTIKLKTKGKISIKNNGKNLFFDRF